MAIIKQMKELGFNAKYYVMIRAPDGPTWSQNLGKDGDYVVLGPGTALHPDIPTAKAIMDGRNRCCFPWIVYLSRSAA